MKAAERFWYQVPGFEKACQRAIDSAFGFTEILQVWNERRYFITLTTLGNETFTVKLTYKIVVDEVLEELEVSNEQGYLVAVGYLLGIIDSQTEKGY